MTGTTRKAGDFKPFGWSSDTPLVQVAREEDDAIKKRLEQQLIQAMEKGGCTILDLPKIMTRLGYAPADSQIYILQDTAGFNWGDFKRRRDKLHGESQEVVALPAVSRAYPTSDGKKVVPQQDYELWGKPREENP